MEPITYGGIPCSTLTQGRRDLVLPQLGITDFVNSPRRPYPSEKEGSLDVDRWEKERDGELGLLCKTRKYCFLKIKS